MAVGKEIRKKIGSVRNTQKITSAMEMVAASKMRRAQDRMQMGKPYATRIRTAIGHLANANPDYRHPYMIEREVRHVGYIVVSSDKGLCGGLNINLFRLLTKHMQQLHQQGIRNDLALVGARAASFFRAFGGNVQAAISNVGENPQLEDLIGSIKVMLDAYIEERIDRLFIASNEFVNTMTQRPVIRQLLPLERAPEDDQKHRWDYIYEPDPVSLIEGVIQRFIESQVYQAVVENFACEQAAKMIAMKSASENAETIIEELTLVYNNVRQAAITQEIAEIVGGASAVS
jgi:F-type H+-transporting ATPase subunit gamma